MTSEENTPQLDEKACRINICVGYGWHKDESVHNDVFWKSLQPLLDEITGNVNRSAEGHPVKVSIGRLRASHAEFVWENITRRIENADVLIFDVAETKSLIKDMTPEEREKTSPESQLKASSVTDKVRYTAFNSNVLVEIGVAFAKGKRPLLLCPKDLLAQIPSDLTGYLWTAYDLVLDDAADLKRVFTDRSGFSQRLLGLVRQCVREKIEKYESKTPGV